MVVAVDGRIVSQGDMNSEGADTFFLSLYIHCLGISSENTGVGVQLGGVFQCSV
jgi:hypothetical protein